MPDAPQTIWMINPYAIPPTQPGGTRHYDFASEMVKRGHGVSIFASDINLNTRKHHTLGFGRLSKTQDIDGIRFVWVNSLLYTKNNWKRIANFFSFMFAVIAAGLFKKKPGVIIGSTPHPFSALAGLVLARLKRTRFVLEVRDLWPQTLIEGGAMTEGSAKVRLLQWVERLLYRNAEWIVVLAKGSTDYIVNLGIDADRILFVPNGVHLASFKTTEPREQTRDRLGLTDQFVVMYAGAHGHLNALHTILGAAEHTKDRDDIAYVFVGDGTEKENLKQRAQEQGLTNVTFLDAVAKAQVPDLLDAADALAITLLNVELFQYGVSPNKLFDYMAIGRPVLCAVGGDMAGIVTESGAGVTLPPEDSAAMADAIVKLVDDPDEAAKYRGVGRAYIEEHFDREKLVARLLERLAT